MIIRTDSLSSGSVSSKDGISINNTKENLQDSKTNSNSISNVSTAANTINSEEIDNSNKIENIKAQIDDGNYDIDIKKTSERMAQDLLV